MYASKYFVFVLSLVVTIANGVHSRTIAGNSFFPAEESQPQVENLYLNDQDPEQEQQFRFPTENQVESLAREVDPAVIAVEDTEAGIAGTGAEEDEDPEIDAKFLSNIDVNNLTPEQRSVYDQLIELAKEEEEAGNSQVQGRTFGLFKLKFHYLWSKFKSLFKGPKFLEFYSEPDVVPVIHPHQQYGQPHYFGDDFKKRNELSSAAVEDDAPISPPVQYRVENPLLSIPIVGDLTKFITRTIPKFYYDTFYQPYQPQQSSRRNYYNRRSTNQRSQYY